MAPCKFDIVKAREAHRMDPHCLDVKRLLRDKMFARTYGLHAILQQRFHDAIKTTLQPEVIRENFQSVSTYDELITIADYGVDTTVHESFQPNQGYNCPTYPDTIADPTIIVDHLYKLHDSGQFLMLPLDLVRTLCREERLDFNTSPFSITRKSYDPETGDPRGRLVFNFSHNGPNHPDKKLSLASRYGDISPPQIGNICQLIQNAHSIFHSSSNTLIAIRRDIKAAFNHMRYGVRSTLLCAAQVLVGDVMYCVFPSVAVMGDQVVNSCFNQVSRAIDESLSSSLALSTGSSLSISTVATDDIIAIGPPSLMSSVKDEIGLLVGDGRKPGLCSSISAILTDKDLQGECIVILGWLFSIPNKTFCPNSITYAKLVYCMFVVVGTDPKPGQSITVGELMLVGAHAMRAANALIALIDYSRGFLHNTRGSSDPDSVVYLTHRTCEDIRFWRLLLTMAIKDARVLFCRTSSPLFRMHLPTDTALCNRDTRSIDHADVIAYSDACTGSLTEDLPPGLGGYIPGIGYFGIDCEPLRYIATLDGVLAETSINILELLALITTASLTIQLHIQQHGTARGCHFHIFCDNISAIAKARTHRSEHPIYTYLLHLLSYVQLHHGCTVGSSFHPGILNTIADAASRCFRVPNGQYLYNQYLRRLPRYQPSVGCIRGISKILLSSKPNVLLLPVPTLIGLEQVTSTDFL